MKPTRSFWALAFVVAGLGGLAVLFDRPVLLVGAAGIAGALLALQYRFYRALARLDAVLDVDQSVQGEYVTKGQRTPVTLAASLDGASILDMTVEAGPPLAADGVDADACRVDLPAGEREGAAATALDWPVVGRHVFDHPTVTATDPTGLFVEEFPRGPRPTVTVEPRTPDRIHVGEGGDQVLASYGGHRSDQLGPGTDPAEIREYVPGDSVSDIDWKATARHAFPHVREYEVETDRQTVLVLDHRSGLDLGRPGETAFDYLREIALSFADSAREHNDPLGLAVVGDGGTERWESPGTNPDTYRTIETALGDLDAPGGSSGDRTTSRDGAGRTAPGTARRKAALLAGGEAAFDRRVAPFLAETDRFVRRIDDDPLFGTVRTQLERTRGAVWAVILTDDRDRTEVRETVKLARQRAASVTVFLTPRVLFEAGGLGELDRAYDGYVVFEEFRRELARLDGVHAFEVGPADRVEAVLAAGRERRG